MKLVLIVETFSQDEGKYDTDHSYYVVNDFKVPGWSKEELQEEVDRLTKLSDLEHHENYSDGGCFYQNVVSWSVEEDDYVTPYDKQQEKWDREYHDPVRYWSPTIDQETGKVFRKIRGWDRKIYINNELVEDAA